MLGLGTLSLIASRVGSFIKSIVTNGLQIWLPFTKTEILEKDLIVNGDFGTDSNWSKSGASISGGAAYLPDGGTSVSQVIGTEVGRLYHYTLVAKSTAGEGALEVISDTVVQEIPSVTGSIPSTYTTYTGTFVAGDDTIKLRESLDGEIYIDSISIKEVSQFAPDKSANTNDAKLFTGKALSFDGTNDSVDADYSSSTRTIAFWLKPRGSETSEGIMYLGYSGGQMGLKFGSSTISSTVLTGVTTYVNNVNTTSINSHVWQRVVITADLFTPTVLRLGYTYLNNYGDFSITDLQFYDTAWTAADVSYDYNNPQNLVTDNSDSSIALSNLKGYWALSEGEGAYTYNSEVPLGSEEVTNGDFATDDGWVKGTGWSISGGSANAYQSTDDLYRENVVESGKYYKVTYTISNYISGSVRVELPGNAAAGVERSANGTYTEILLSVGTIVMFDARTSFTGSIDNVTVKEVSVGEITGATWETAQATIPQLGMMDWAKSTVGSDEITLIQAPNNEGYDILGNTLRLRGSGLNLDGSGYAEVADDDSLDFGTGDFTLECWIYMEDGGIRRIIDKRDSSNGYTLSLGISNGLDLELDDGTGDAFFTLSSTLTEDEWSYITVVGDRGGDATCFINGVAKTPISIAGKSGSLSSSSSLFIGTDAPSGDTYYSTDLIDGVRIYNRALSSDEIEQNYNATKSAHKN
ncbi:MAG: LamG domain-containing protein [Gammaproteobacteria bacterium]|nr:LamG domain-containing protein [Gammaproteobacteria bacterium]